MSLDTTFNKIVYVKLKTLGLILLSNLIVLFGVLFFSGRIGEVVFFFWFDCALVYTMTLFKIRVSGASRHDPHLTAILRGFALKGFAGTFLVTSLFITLMQYWDLFFYGTRIPVLLIFCTLSLFKEVNAYRADFIGKKQFQFFSIPHLKWDFAVHVIMLWVVLFSLYLAMITVGAYILTTVVFVICKFFLDLILHIREQEMIHKSSQHSS
ncbi:MAG: hypothetical protein ACD_62C00432G0006 [uncultured bacterium]|nr:MAG: hypothetical protein ACD_62C00432G0006 [uncultured bacterium]